MPDDKEVEIETQPDTHIHGQLLVEPLKGEIRAGHVVVLPRQQYIAYIGKNAVLEGSVDGAAILEIEFNFDIRQFFMGIDAREVLKASA